MTKKRTEIPSETAARVLFLSDRTCCVCNAQGKPVQLHHVDDTPSNNLDDNLAVLCFDCHRATQISGGFDRKLDAAQIRLYRQDWLTRVEARRGIAHASPRQEVQAGELLIRYLQVEEKSDEHRYSFNADYALIGSSQQKTDKEVNLIIEAFIRRHQQRFRANAIARTHEKNEQKLNGFGIAWDSLSISHSVSLLTPSIFSQEFSVTSYFAGAAHPNAHTEVLNFRLQPPMELELADIFKTSDNYLRVLSDYCIDDLHTQQPPRWHNPIERAEQLKNAKDSWIMDGAGPRVNNFERLSIRKHGVVIHFDPYHVGSYAEGKYEVFIPSFAITSVLQDDIAKLLKWN